MSKKKMWILASTVCLVAIAVCFVFFGRKPMYIADANDSKTIEKNGVQYEVVKDAKHEIEVLAVAETEEMAKDIADLYKITYVDFRDGIAVYKTEEFFSVLEETGKENGYPELSMNNKVSINEN